MKKELLRAEWAIGLPGVIPPVERTPCFLFELMREAARHPELCYDSGENHFIAELPEGFESPYLLLAPKKRKFLQGYFWSVADKNLAQLAKFGRSDTQIVADVEQLLYHRSLIKRRRAGRGALPAQLQTNLKVLAAYRILQVHKWNRLPPNVPDIDLYYSQREWSTAAKRAEYLIRHAIWLEHNLCGKYVLPRWNSLE